MGILQSLFGIQPQGQGPDQTTGLVQSILSQRFQPQSQDIAQSIFLNGTGLGGPNLTTPEAQSVQRLSPVLDVAKTIGGLNQSQIELSKLNEMIRHDTATEGQNPFNQPITTAPTNPNQNPVNIPATMRGNAQSLPQPLQSSMSIPQVMQGNAQSFPMPPDGRKNIDNPNLSRSQSQAAIGQLFDQPDSNPSNPSPSQSNAALTPLFKGNQPYKDGLAEGYQWAQTPDGRQVAMQIPGTIQKGANGEVLTSDQSGNVTEATPPNPVMKQKFEENIQKIASLFDDLNNAGGSVEAGGDWKTNKLNQLAATKGLNIGGFTVIPGGQTLMEGTKTQQIRGQIQDLIKQTTPLYMQAMGITPGMERAVSAQQMLMDALGGNVGKTRQENLYSIANLSQQAGTGDFARKYQSQNQQSQQPAQYDQTATNPQTGQKIGLINGQWEAINGQ